MKEITFQDIQKMHIPPEQCFEWVSKTIRHKKDALLPAKIHMALEGNVFCNVMPSILHFPDASWGGVKVVTRYPERVPALDSKILLFDAKSGEFLALMDANWITAMRTGAVAAHSILHLAKKDFRTVGIIGLGNTARATMLVLASMVKRELEVKLLRYKDQAQLFMERFADYPNLHFTVVDDAASLVKGTEVVVSCATYFENDICSDDCFDEGVLVVPVHTRGFTNCDLFFDKVFADDRGHVDHFKNFSKFKYFAEMCDVVNGRDAGRESDTERILAYNIGISIHDICFAAEIFQKLKKDPEQFDRLKGIDLHEPEEKFWL